MIITRTPYRISFFGGGTDYHAWYQTYGGAVLSTTINHYCYIQCRLLPPFFKYKSRIACSDIQEVLHNNDITHPSVREVLRYLNITEGVEINHQGDLPSRSGLGSSSAFTVGLLHTIYALQGLISSKRQLACEAIHIERDVLQESVGVQDHIATAYGGLNKIVIRPDGDFDVSPLILPKARLHELHNHMMLFFTGVSRTASEIAADKIRAIPRKTSQLHQMHGLVDIAEKILCSNNDISEFGELLHETWQLKRQLSTKVAPAFIDKLYQRARKAGAISGKLLGEGGGGFMLLFVKPEDQARVCAALNDLLLVPFDFDNGGSQIIFHDPHLQGSKISKPRENYVHLRPQHTDDLKEGLRERPTRLHLVASKPLIHEVAHQYAVNTIDTFEKE